MMPSDRSPSPGDFLLRQLRSCSGPFSYRSGVSRLLGLPDRGAQQITYPLPVPPMGFRYRLSDAIDRHRTHDMNALHLSDAPDRLDRPSHVSDARPDPPASEQRGVVRSDRLSGYVTSLEHNREVDEDVGAQRVIGGATALRHPTTGAQDLPGGASPPSAGHLPPVDLTVTSATAPRNDDPGRPVSAPMPAAASLNPPPATLPLRSRIDVAPPVGDGPRRLPRDLPAVAGPESTAGRPRPADWSRDSSQAEPVRLSPRPDPATSPRNRPRAPRPPVTEAPTMLPRPQPAERKQVEELRDAAARQLAQPASGRQEASERPATPPSASPPPAARKPPTLRRPPRMGSGIPRAFWASSTLRSAHLGVLR